MPYEYDLFISYSSADGFWADTLHAELTKRDANLRIFLDRHSLRAGEKWEDQLNAALQASRHFAVLWSNGAADPLSWVGPEIQTFEAAARACKNPNERLLLYVPLEGKRPNLESLQGFPDIRKLKLYGKETQLSEQQKKDLEAAWARIADGVITAVRRDPNTELVPLAVLTLCRREFDEIQRDERYVAMNLDKLLGEIGTLSYEKLRSRYLTKPLEWQPFGGPRSILNLFDSVLVKINAALRAENERTIGWDTIDFAGIDPGNDDAVARIVGRLNSTFSVLVIDPIALYHPRIKWLFGFFQSCLTNDRTVTITLSVIENPAPFHVSYSVRNLARPIFEAYFEPPVKRGSRFSNFGMNIDHDSDVRRLIMLGLLQSRGVFAPNGGNAFTGTRAA